MIDGMGRTIDYVRISVTDRFNLRCVYCMPEEGVPMLKHADILTYDEIEYLCKIVVTLGITKVNSVLMEKNRIWRNDTGESKTWEWASPLLPMEWRGI